jgi:hypothetical protein
LAMQGVGANGIEVRGMCYAVCVCVRARVWRGGHTRRLQPLSQHTS